jgi:hypothetical protein
MSEAVQILAQVSPAANTSTSLFATLSTSAVISSIVICNTNSTTQTFTIWLVPGGATNPSTKQYLYYQLPILANDTFIATIGVTMATTSGADALWCSSNAAGLAFNVFGVSIT